MRSVLGLSRDSGVSMSGLGFAAAALCVFVCLSVTSPIAIGCTHRFDGTVYRHGDLAFRLGEKPDHWRRIDASDALVAYRSDAKDYTVAVNARCRKDGDDVSLEALTQHLFMLFTERDIRGRQKMMIDGRETLRTMMVAKLDGVKLGFVVYVLKKNGCVYDFIWIGPSERIPQASGDYNESAENTEHVEKNGRTKHRAWGLNTGRDSLDATIEQDGPSQFDRYVQGFRTLE